MWPYVKNYAFYVLNPGAESRGESRALNEPPRAVQGCKRIPSVVEGRFPSSSGSREMESVVEKSASGCNYVSHYLYIWILLFNNSLILSLNSVGSITFTSGPYDKINIVNSFVRYTFNLIRISSADSNITSCD